MANETLYKALYGKDDHLGHLRAIRARAFVHVETHTKMLEHRVWEGHLIGCRVDKSFRVYNSSTRRVRESRNVIFIDTSSVLPEPALVSCFVYGEFTYDDYDDTVSYVRYYTSTLDFSTSAAADRAVEYLSVRDLLEQIRETTDRDLGFIHAGSGPSGDPSVDSPSDTSPGGEIPSWSGGGSNHVMDVVRVVVLFRVVDVVRVVALRRSIRLPDQQRIHPMQEL